MPSSLVAGRIGCAALVAVALCRCGLSADGQGALAPDGGPSSGSSSSGSYAGSSSGTVGPGSSGSSGSGSGFDANGEDDADPADVTAPLRPGDAAIADARIDGAPRDAAADGPSTCAKLAVCCPLLATYGSSPSSVQSCMEAAATNDEGTCETVLSPLEGVYLCP